VHVFVFKRNLPANRRQWLQNICRLIRGTLFYLEHYTCMWIRVPEWHFGCEKGGWEFLTIQELSLFLPRHTRLVCDTIPRSVCSSQHVASVQHTSVGKYCYLIWYSGSDPLRW